jgi:hypothetical protein
MLIRISAPHFVAGYDMTTGNIAPIIKYMKGWSYDRILNYCNSKGWELQWLTILS